jgi:hypothetical protein
LRTNSAPSARVSRQEIAMPSKLVRRPLDESLLGKMLEDPGLVPRLRALPVPVLRQAILRVGLEDAGELIALASLDQLRGLFDEDLWHCERPGQDEEFDACRFVVWLEVLLEAGDAFVADRLAELSEDFLVFAFAQILRVLDTAMVAASIADADEAGLIDKVLDSQICQELDEYLIVSRVESGWDALWVTVLALDARHPELLRAVLHRCWLATREQAERAGGLYAGLSGEEFLLENARAEREERRARRGYVSPADARAFLNLTRRVSDSLEPDPITRAYFRDLQPASVPEGVAEAASRSSGGEPVRLLLAAAGVEPAPDEAAAALTSQFRAAVSELGASHPGAHQRVVEEIVYLANVLLAGDESRSWRPAEAAEHVMRLCDEGLSSVLSRSPQASAGSPRDALLRWGAVGLFRLAWRARARNP